MIVYMNLTSVRQLSAHECDAAVINAGRLHVYSRLNQYLSLERGIAAIWNFVSELSKF